jgi:putative transposase
MARIARVIIPNLPHHVTQRGNGRQKTFFTEADYELYRNLLASSCKKARVSCLAWVLMPNHVHLILVPRDEDGLRAALAPVHRAYAGIIHARRKKTGHFWQGRFGTTVMDESHLAEAFRYVLSNPVRAKLVTKPEAWEWSSARAYLKGREDGLTDTGPMLERFPDIKALLSADENKDNLRRLRAAESVGRPIGNAAFMKVIERKSGRKLAAAKPGRKPKLEV